MSQNDASSGANDRPQPRKRSRFRWVWRGGLIAVALIVVVLAALPSMISDGWLKAKLTGAVSEQMNGSLSIDRLSVGWFSTPAIEAVAIKDADGNTIASVASITADATLWSLATGGRNLGVIAIDQPTADIVQNADGTTNLQVALGDLLKADPEAPDEPISLPITGKLKVTGGRITATGPDIEPVTISNLTAEGDASEMGKPVSLSLSADTRQGGQRGKLTGSATVRGFNARGVLVADDLHLTAEADVTHLPLEGIDAIAGTGGRLANALGKTLDLHAKIAGDPAGKQTITLTARAPRLDATFDGAIAADRFDGKAHVKFTAAPAFIADLTDGRFTLAGDTPLTLDVPTLMLPVAEFDPTRVVATVKLDVADGAIVGDDRLGTLAWSNLSGNIDTANLAESITVSLGAATSAGGQAGKLSASGTADKLFDPATALPNGAGMMLNGEVALSGIPPKIIDALADADGLIVDLLGNTAAFTVTAVSSGPKDVKLTAALASDNLQADLPLAMTDRVRTTGPATLTLRDPAPLVARYAADLDYHLAFDQPLTLAVTTLDAPRPKPRDKRMIQPADTTLIAKLSTTDVRVTDPADAQQKLGPLTIGSFTVDLTGDKLDRPKLDAAVALAAGDGGQFSRYIAEQFELTARASTAMSGDLQPGPIDVTVRGRSTAPAAQPLGRVALAGRIASDFSTFSLSESGTVNYLLMPGHLRAAEGGPTLAGDVPITLTLEELTTALAGFDPAKLKAKLVAEIKRAELAGDPQFAGATLGDAKLNATLDAAANTAAVRLVGTTTLPGAPRPGAIDAAASVEHWHARGKVAMNQSLVKFERTTLTDLPLAFVEAITGQSGLVEHLGQTADVTLAGTVDGSDVTATFNVDAVTMRDGRQGAKLHVKGGLANWAVQRFDQLLAQATGTISARADSVPTVLIESLTGQAGLLVPNIGPTIDVSAAVMLPETGDRRVELALAGEQLTMPRGRAVIALGDLATLDKPFDIEWQLTRAGFAAIQQHAADGTLAHTTLKEPTRATLTVNTLRYPLPTADQPAGFDPAKVTLDAGLKMDRLALAQKVDQRTIDTTFTSLTGSVKTTDLTKQLNLKLAGQPDAAAGTTEALALDVDLLKLFDETGKLNEDQLAAIASLVRLPITLVDAITGAQGKLVAALGKVTDGELKFNDQGDGKLTATLDAQHAKVNLVGRVDEAGVFRLTQPMVATFEVTPEFGAQLLQSIHPVFETAYTSDQPIKFTIPHDPNQPDATMVPTRGFDLTKVRIDQAVLDLGRVKMKQGGILTGLNKLLKRTQHSDSSIWFTPLVVSLKDGKLAYTRRLDMLIDNSYHLASWGSVQFAGAQKQAAGQPLLAAYEMTLGMPATTLSGVFGLSNVPANAMFVVPVRGTTTKKEIDFGKALGSLTRVITEDQALGRLLDELTKAGGPLAQALLKKPIDDARRKLNEALGGNPPPMSVDKLPWADQVEPPQRESDADADAPKNNAQNQQDNQNDNESIERRILRGLLD